MTQAIHYKKAFLRFAEIWFRRSTAAVSADVARYMQVPDYSGTHWWQRFHTLNVDLTSDEDAVLGRMERGTRYEIRRAQNKDALHYENTLKISQEHLDKFALAYSVNILDTSLKLNVKKLEALSSSGCLGLTRMLDQDGRILVWHVYIMGGHTARLLHSVSVAQSEDNQDRRNLCGRANRLHHWKDMQWLKNSGYDCYDFGGYYAGDKDQKKLRINAFKRGFGGEVAASYNCMQARTLLGKIALGAWQLRNREY
jgi:hypothetical protein